MIFLNCYENILCEPMVCNTISSFLTEKKKYFIDINKKKKTHIDSKANTFMVPIIIVEEYRKKTLQQY